MSAAEYDRMLIFTEPLTDKALSGHVIRTEIVANEGSCRVKCYLEPNCVSINVGPADDGKQMCELNDVTDESPAHSAWWKDLVTFTMELRYAFLTFRLSN